MPKWKNITVRQVVHIVSKLSLEQSNSKRRSKHPVFWYVLDGKKVLRITLPNQHGGAKSLSTGFLIQIRKALRLSTREFEELVACPLSAEQYEQIVRKRLNLPR